MAAAHFRGADQVLMTRRKPNLFLIGTMKSGTTYLRKLLNAHPDIFMCDPDEPSYFVDPRWLRTLYPEMWERGLWRSEGRYLDLFRPAGDARILGEASTNYTMLPLLWGVPQRIAAFNPEARFIYLLRDLVERTISHYWHVARHHAEHRPIAEAVRRDPQFVAVSHYAMQLRPFLERFGHERIAVLIHEQLVADPRGVMGNLYRWLGVNAAWADVSEFSEPENLNPRNSRRTRLGRNTTAAAAGPGPEGRHGPDSGVGPRSAASSDHAGSTPARHRPDRSGGTPASQAEAADRRLGGGARLQLPRMDNAVWHILLRDTDSAAGASPSASVDHREAIARATVTLAFYRHPLWVRLSL